MINYLEEYASAQNSISTTKQTVNKNHISHYRLLEESLGMQFLLNKKFVEFYSSAFNNVEKINAHFVEISTHLLFYYNVQSLQTALNTLECNFIHQAAVNLRTVYEAIPKMYYISLFPKKTREIIVHEYIHNLKYEDAINEIKTKKIFKILNGEKLEFRNKTHYDKFRKKYNPAWFRKQLYTPQRVKSLQSLYDKFSNSTHANISRNEVAVQYTFQDTDLFFQLLKSLSYFNIEAYLEGNYFILHELGLDSEILNFLNKFGKNLETIIENVYFFPNLNDLESKLKTSRTPT